MSSRSRILALRISILLAFVFAIRVAHGLPISLQERDEVVCTAADWQTVIIFLLLNYATHASTVKAFPGDTLYDMGAWSVAALLAPYSGIVRGCASILRGRIWGDNQLNNALRAGALCALVRTDSWKPDKNETVAGCKISGITSTTTGGTITASLRLKPLSEEESNPFDPRGPILPDRRVIQGQFILPEGYQFEILPNYVSVVPLYDVETSPELDSETKGKVAISNSQNVIKSIASIIQLGYAMVTLYRTRGDQIEQYGYAAFGLTVLQYAVMSLVNLLANILTPDYPALCMVRSEIMEEAEGRGGKFDGMVGRIEMGDGPQESGGKIYDLHLDAVDNDTSDITNPETREEDNTVIASYSTDPNRAVSEKNAHEVQQKEADKLVGKTLVEAFKEGWQEARRDSCEAKRTRISVTFNDPGHLVHGPKESKPVVIVPAAGRYAKWQPTSRLAEVYFYCAIVAGLAALITPWIVIAALTRFQNGSSTKAQRGWTISWLVLGQFCGFALVMVVSQQLPEEKYWEVFMVVAGALTYSIASIGGMVVVVQMILAFGSCVLV